MADIQKLTYPYFTDGSTALDAQNLNPIISKLNEVIEAVNSGVTPTPTQTVATPTISIDGTTATISCSTSGATIYYTTNGNTPTTSSTQYSSPITLSGACTIKAIAVKSGMNNSQVKSVDYTPASSNLITTLKNGQKANASTGEFESNSDYISTDWIDVDNVAFATLTLASSVAAESQVDGSVTAGNCKIGIVYQDNSGNYHDIALANNFIASTYTAETLPLKIPVREMKKISLYSLTSEASSSDTILKCNSSDWNAATLVVDTLNVSGTETYGSEIWNHKAIGGGNGVSANVNQAFGRYQSTNMVQFMTMIKSGESVSLHTKGGSTGRAWYKYALDGSQIAKADASVDYNTNAYTFTADQDMFLVGTAYTAEAEQFELEITKP